ncbi:neuroguidin [Agrilus planipennis]|uniref:Neuroguidin n=1 Tax=Agrilus planipennis TaxID=224129 RepID=A0A1W4X3F6_AGRPL|nr:neuroguidin [Agrilus planipennis]
MVQAPEGAMGHPNLPQALILLNEMNSSTQHVASLVDNMLQRVRKGEISTDQGLSFLEMKYHTLLSYLINLTFIVLRKCSGENIEGDPCIDRLIELRTVLEKIRPIDHKLKYQIDKLVKTAVSGREADDATLYKANPKSLMDNSDSDSDEDSDNSEENVKSAKSKNVYVPPKLAAVHFMDDTAVERNKRAHERNKKHALSTSVIEELKEEYLDTPVEIAQNNRAQQILTKQQKERQEYEEEYLTRLPVTKVEKQMRKKLTTMGSLGHELTDFGSNKKSTKRKSSMKGKGKKNFKRKRFH